MQVSRLVGRPSTLVEVVRVAEEDRRLEVRMCRVKGLGHDALVESGLVDVVGVQHLYDTVPAAKTDRPPDALPVVPERGTSHDPRSTAR